MVAEYSAHPDQPPLFRFIQTAKILTHQLLFNAGLDLPLFVDFKLLRVFCSDLVEEVANVETQIVFTSKFIVDDGDVAIVVLYAIGEV